MKAIQGVGAAKHVARPAEAFPNRGERVGPFGKVYRAKDTPLKCDGVLKSLPSERIVWRVSSAKPKTSRL